MDGSVMRGVLAVTAAVAATLAMLAPQASATTKNVNFVGTWKTSNNQPFTIKKENRKSGACSGTTSLSKIGAYKLVACHVKGNHYAFTITYGPGYKSYNKGAITGNKLKGNFRDINGASGIYSAVRTKL
jgi:hypothetical protein